MSEGSKERDTMTTQLCPRCRFHPASPRTAGYCSWDCYDADGEDAEDEDEGENGGKEAA
jgi:hypothetical protein